MEDQSFQYLNLVIPRHLSPESRSEEYANMAFYAYNWCKVHACRLGVYIYAVLVAFKCCSGGN